jgi:sarcosine oxidase
VFQPDGGILAAEASVEALVEIAENAGAKVRAGVRVLAFSPKDGGWRLECDGGEIEARAVIIAAGAWVTDLLPNLPVTLRPTREVIAWFKPTDPEPLQPGRLPVFILESRHGMHYGFPSSASGVIKVAKHHHRDETIDANDPPRPMSELDEGLIRPMLAEHLPAANGPLASAKTCIYTMSPDHHFIVDHVPGAPGMIVASACSGHGFKFAPVLGEILADLAIEGETAHDISRFSLARFGQKQH